MTLASLLAFGEAQRWNVSLLLLLFKATLILIAALGITLAMRRASAGTRHLVWLVTLAALALIRVLTAWGPLRVEVLPPAVASAENTPRPTTRATNGAASPLTPLGTPDAQGVQGATESVTDAPHTSLSESAVSSTTVDAGLIARLR